jgi:RHS repeat-associated protein
MYYRNRYYNPETGRFLTNDPLGITPNPQSPNVFNIKNQYTDGMNLYECVKSNPLIENDAHGLFGKCGSGPWGIPIPDKWHGVDFGSACEKHDKCYSGIGADKCKPKRDCDREFCKNLKKACSSINNGQFRMLSPGFGAIPPEYIIVPKEQLRYECQKMADKYCLAVSMFGQHPFDKARCPLNYEPIIFPIIPGIGPGYYVPTQR